MILDELTVPIVLAPLAGGPSTPELAAAVSEAGGLGFLASGYLSAEVLSERRARLRELTERPIGINVFAPGGGPSEPSGYRDYLDHLREWSQRTGAELGEPRYSDDDWEAKLDLLANDPVRVVSFTFGCPPAAVVQRLQRSGSEVWVTVTSQAEAQEAAQAGADALVVQGAEAGGHRGSFVDRPGSVSFGLLPLLALVGSAVRLPLVASGGITTGAAVAAALAAGARAAQLGTAFMLSPEAGTSPAHRQALRGAGTTVLTRAFTGRQARGIRNRFIEEHESAAAVAYPELHYVTAPMRARARAEGDVERINLWAGEAHELALERPAGELVARLAAEARVALETAARRLQRP
jgi:nitronate monooxygenase